MTFETTATRVWRRLTPDERHEAARAFWRQPGPQDGAALAALVKARHLRPQVARSLPEESRARYLAALLEPGEAVAAALLVSLHVNERRPLLITFLDALGLPHEDGILTEAAEDAPPPSVEAAGRGIAALAREVPLEQVRTYLNTLWLQDPERWEALRGAYEAFAASPAASGSGVVASSRAGSSSQ